MGNLGHIGCALTLLASSACSTSTTTNAASNSSGGSSTAAGNGGATFVATSGASSIGGSNSTVSGGNSVGGAATGGTNASASGATTGLGGSSNLAGAAMSIGGTTSAGAPSGGAAMSIGGTTSAGAPSGGAVASGGASVANGGAATGGTVSAGSGGVATGGAGVGGVSTGGVAAGGTATGGVGTGGATTTRYALNVSFAGNGAGTVVLEPGNTTCTAPTPCVATFDSGTTVTLTAKPTNSGTTVSSVLSGWSGACAGGGPNRQCALSMTATTSTAAVFSTLPANLAFVTSTTFAGNLGGAAAYQLQCNNLATAAGLNVATNDAYVAWMIASNYSPVTLLGASRGWVRADLLPWIDDMAAALTTGAVYYPVAYDENGKRVFGDTLSGMIGNGTLYTGQNCADWTNTTGNTSHGSTHAGGKGWTYDNIGVSSCNNKSRILCLSKGVTSPVAVATVAGKRIYLTKSGWVPGGGVSAADARCLADAPATVTAAKAVIVASTRALADVLLPATVYVRPDGVKVGTGTEIVQALNAFAPPVTIESAVTQDGGGNFVDTAKAQLVWTGLGNLGTADKDTCRDWTSAAATDSATGGGVATGWSYAGKNGSFACDNSWLSTAVVYLQCAEQ